MKPIGQEIKRENSDQSPSEARQLSNGVRPGDTPAQFIEEFARTPAVTRRSFLNAAGFSISASILAACSQGRIEEAVPYLMRPAEVTPGKATWYASTCSGCSAGCGILVKNRDGRPIKIEGNPDHPLSRGGVCPVGQATVLDLYDSHHFQQPYIAGEAADWERVDQEIRRELDRPRGAVYFLTGTITSPTTRALINRFLEPYDDSAHVTYDPVSYSSILDAYHELRGSRVLPHYHFDRADLIVSFEADFLGTWLSPVEFTKCYRAGRSLAGDPPQMSRHIQFEGRLSLTGCNADERLAVSPPELKRTVVRLVGLLVRRLGLDLHLTDREDPPHAEYLEQLANELAEAKGRSLVISGTRDVATQILVAFINRILENEGKTVDLERPSYQWQGNDKAVFELQKRMEAGEVGALFIAGVNPAHSLPDSDHFKNLLEKVPLTVSLNRKADETSAAVKYLCPTPHFLESWDDAELLPGLYSLTQPLLRQIGATRPLRESLVRWLGEEAADLQILKQYWQEEVFPRSSTDEDFQHFWNRAIRDGFAQVATKPLVLGEIRHEAVEQAAQRQLSQLPSRQTGREGNQLFLVLYESVGLRDGRHAENPWLQEMPDPVTKAVWDNFACLGPETARRLGVENGDVVRLSAVGVHLELPVLLQPGQHEQVVTVALGYGRKGTDRFSKVGPQWLQSLPTVEPGDTVGKNGYLLALFDEDGIRYDRRVNIETTGRRIQVALTQTYESITVPENLGGHRREMVHETTLAAYREDPSSGTPYEDELLQLWPDDFVYEDHHWGMAIDLNACTGCSACVISCQAENNVPVVGKDEVRRRREMHWIRIDRYYSGTERDVDDVLFQPVMCQHCDHAPCEPVCPVLATIHSREGLNQQIYNRCVGTRYCANNCPYKVRRFNWFDYPRNDLTQNLALNPDVTVRARGVMEKCSMCIQRIEEARAEAMRLGRGIEDGEIQPACQQSCPADAIVFGDTNDPDSKVSRLIADSRYYRLLWEMNFRPSVGYLTKVRNRGTTG